MGPGMPDVCVVYKLHLECGQLINLYDWMQVTVVSLHSIKYNKIVNNSRSLGRVVRVL